MGEVVRLPRKPAHRGGKEVSSGSKNAYIPKPVREIAPVELIKRNCLGCGVKFDSEGKHNRLCWPCSKRR